MGTEEHEATKGPKKSSKDEERDHRAGAISEKKNPFQICQIVRSRRDRISENSTKQLDGWRRSEAAVTTKESREEST